MFVSSFETAQAYPHSPHLPRKRASDLHSLLTCVPSRGCYGLEHEQAMEHPSVNPRRGDRGTCRSCSCSGGVAPLCRRQARGGDGYFSIRFRGSLSTSEHYMKNFNSGGKGARSEVGRHVHEVSSVFIGTRRSACEGPRILCSFGMVRTRHSTALINVA